MAQKGRPGLSAPELAQMWKRWKDGESCLRIARALGRAEHTVRKVVWRHGGVAPAAHKHRSGALTLAQREEISRGLVRRLSYRAIAAVIGKAPSTVSREIARNGGKYRYRANVAERRAFERARRPKTCRLASEAKLRAVVASKLYEDWSPQQISGWLKLQYSENAAMQISHEAIYRTLFVQTRGALKKELLAHLRRHAPYRQGKSTTKRKRFRGDITDTVSIRERPAEIEDRAVPGHWEGDLLIGRPGTRIATLVERQSRFTMLIKTDVRDSASVVAQLAKHIQKLPATLRKSLTWDRGSELARHKDFTVATDVKVYFCDPYSPWQRGTNENTNGLLRQYFPKGTDLSKISQAELNRVALKLNQRPRKTLSFATPADKLSELLR